MYTQLFDADNSEGISSKPISVSALTIQIKEVLRDSFPSVWVEGEISNFIHHGSGHMYFTLKDEKAEIRCVMFRGYNQYLRFTPENGMKVLVQGAVTVYEIRGTYQIMVQSMQPAGIGTLYIAFEALKKRLAEEGLFDEDRKLPLPDYPFYVGVITSGTGAAVQDITNILTRRAPHIEIILRPTLVQGDGAAKDIVSALQEFEAWGEVDVLILGRGGGSLEDLWPFNEERVARAITECTIPIISAVGHETDYTIADFVADFRAPTPSAAAEIVSPAKQDLLSILTETERRIGESVKNLIEYWWQRLDGLTTRYGFQQPAILLEQKKKRLTELNDRIAQQITYILSLQMAKFQGISKRLIASSPKSILNRGYSIAYNLPDGQIINSVKKMSPGKEFGLWMADGELVAETKRIIKIEQKAIPQSRGHN